MSAEAEAAKNIVFLGKILSGLLAYAPELERVGSLKDLEAGVNRSIDSLKTEEAVWRQKIEQHAAKMAADKVTAQNAVLEAENDAIKTRNSADEYLKRKQSVAQSVLDDANANLKKIEAKASADAQAMLDQAKAEAQKIDDLTQQAKKALASLESEIVLRQNALKGLQEAMAPALKV